MGTMNRELAASALSLKSEIVGRQWGLGPRSDWIGFRQKLGSGLSQKRLKNKVHAMENVIKMFAFRFFHNNFCK